MGVWRAYQPNQSVSHFQGLLLPRHRTEIDLPSLSIIWILLGKKSRKSREMAAKAKKKCKNNTNQKKMMASELQPIHENL